MAQARPHEPPRGIRPATARPKGEPETAPASLSALADGVHRCRRCDLWRDATQGVPGEGPSAARIMFVGEQPGDQEDLAGHPFVGPAGAILDRALMEADMTRSEIFVTNAVKHFKHEPRGKRRLHKTPNAGEVRACRWWLDHERALIKPRVIVALGATAAKAVLGRPVAVMKARGATGPLPDGAEGFITVHPSLLLRIPDADAKAMAFRDFVRDLKAVRDLAAA
jgi:DNA polymerase